MSRPTSIYSDALETPLEDDSSPMDQDSTRNNPGATDMDLDEHDNDSSMQLDRTEDSTATTANTTTTTVNASSSSSSSSRVPAAPTTPSSAKATNVPAVDEKAQSELRRKIMDIQRNPNIDFTEKARMIQRLMSSKWNENQKQNETQSDDSTEATEEDLKKTFHDEEKTILGCEHYMRGCKLKANCCGKWFNCRFCHDDASDHDIVRSETKTMMCMHCQTIQPAAQSCNSCKNKLAHYYCDICKLWDDDRKRKIYHCDDCGICRKGKGLGIDYFHCEKCNICMNIGLKDNHKCIERNLECDCPICGEYMFTSTTPVIFMPCGHCIHGSCHQNYIKTSYQCPTCWKSLGDMSAYYSKIDSLLAEQTMPPEYTNICSVVLCNDCEVKSEVPYHFLYHRCSKCKGYNTKVLETFQRVSDGKTETVENVAMTTGSTVAAPENNSAHAGPGVGGSSSSSTGAPLDLVSLTNLANSRAARLSFIDANATGEMSMTGMSDNSAP